MKRSKNKLYSLLSYFLLFLAFIFSGLSTSTEASIRKMNDKHNNYSSKKHKKQSKNKQEDGTANLK